ncbi:MAG: hypothetical protein WC567_04705 [Kiritimatiellia bacterium]
MEQDAAGARAMDAYAAYARFFGLNPTNSADACLDFDGDRLNTLQEFDQLTDPFAPDTDRDGFEDDMDANPISRAYIQWGAPQFTTGDFYDYAHPDWFLTAYKNGGEWIADQSKTSSSQSTISNPKSAIPAWYAPASESNGIASLSLDLDRTILTNNLRYAIHYSSGRAGQPAPPSLYVDLLDTNGVFVVKDLYGNMMEGTNAESVVVLDIPTGRFANAAVIHLRRGTGDVTVFEGQLYIDEDGDGLDADQERQLGTSDYLIDTDGDRISDYDKCFGGGSSTNRPAGGGNDDGKDNDRGKNKDKKVGIIYVDQAVGNDQHTGRARNAAGQDGPKKTVRKGLSAVDEDQAHTLVIKSGAYHENIDLRGKNVKVVIEGNVRL